MLAGRATLTNEATGESITLKAGDHFFIEFGQTITWEVLETVRKVYAMYEDEYDEGRNLLGGSPEPYSLPSMASQICPSRLTPP